MANNYQSFDEWFLEVQRIGKALCWHVENPDEWRIYYNQGMSPKDAFEQEVS